MASSRANPLSGSFLSAFLPTSARRRRFPTCFERFWPSTAAFVLRPRERRMGSQCWMRGSGHWREREGHHQKKSSSSRRVDDPSEKRTNACNSSHPSALVSGSCNVVDHHARCSL